MNKLHPSPDKFAATVKVGPKGQILIPKEVRDMFHIQPGDSLLLLADHKRGVALQTYAAADPFFDALFPDSK